MKIDHENSLADIASILVALRADWGKVVSGIRNWALESNCLVVTQEINHCRQWVPYVQMPNFQVTIIELGIYIYPLSPTAGLILT